MGRCGLLTSIPIRGVEHGPCLESPEKSLSWATWQVLETKDLETTHGLTEHRSVFLVQYNYNLDLFMRKNHVFA